jgi:hypothetical protein
MINEIFPNKRKFHSYFAKFRRITMAKRLNIKYLLISWLFCGDTVRIQIKSTNKEAFDLSYNPKTLCVFIFRWKLIKTIQEAIKKYMIC